VRSISDIISDSKKLNGGFNYWDKLRGFELLSAASRQWRLRSSVDKTVLVACFMTTSFANTLWYLQAHILFPHQSVNE
jgi:hypothetical protein